jgi:Undecaprenyl-phosphate galactose phosphotransferase WbaP
MRTFEAIEYSLAPTIARRRPAPMWPTSLCIFTADLLALSIVYWIAVVGRYWINPNYDLHFYIDLYPILALFLGAFYIHNLYPGVLLHPAEEMRRVFKCISVVFLLIGLSTFFERNSSFYSRSIFLVVWACGAPCILLARGLTRKKFAEKPWWGIPAVILGHGPCATRVIQTLSKRNIGLRLAGLFADDLAGFSDVGPIPKLGKLSEAPQFAKVRHADYVIVAMPDRGSAEIRHIVQNYCHGFRHVLLVPDLPGICSLGIAAHEIGGEVGLELPQRLWHTWACVSKRLFDVFASAFFLLLASPLFLLVTLAIKLTSNGPVFFGHARYGQDGVTFKALKFRTMAQDADQLLTSYLEAHPELREEWKRDHKLRNDPRITGVGKWLRRYSMDELPQLVNVLRGQMSLVGPRPIVESEIHKYGDGYDLYTRVPPGITGLWQVSGRNKTTYAERVALDEYYVRNWSVWLDAYILIKTIKAVVTADGAY